jgi:uncharacterized membrane protein YcaP (DUF421 family)
MGLLAIAARALVAYGFLLVLLRVSGKRSVSHSSPFDFVMALVLGDMVDDLLWAEVGLAQFVVAAGTLVVLETALAAAQVRSARIHSWVTGDAVVVLRDGLPARDALRRERVRDEDLEAHLRVHGVERGRWSDLRAARLEAGGGVSVLRTERAQPIERRDVAKEQR